MRTIFVSFLLLCLPTISQASVFGFLFGTDDPQVEVAKRRMKHEREIAKLQSQHELKMAKATAKHQKDMAKRGVIVRASTKPTTFYVQRGTVRFYYVK